VPDRANIVRLSIGGRRKEQGIFIQEQGILLQICDRNDDAISAGRSRGVCAPRYLNFINLFMVMLARRAAALRGGHSQGDKPSAEILVAAGNSEGLGPTPRRSADRAENKNYYPFNGKLPAHGATSAIT
jgi:hypothetical protein